MPASPRVKQEEIATDEFVFEMATAAPVVASNIMPMAEVPLRATWATKEMRKMMGVYHLDPFAMHNGQRGAAVANRTYVEIGPLKEAPQYFEFQLELAYLVRDDSDSASEDGPKSPSPSPSLSSVASHHYSLDEDSRRPDEFRQWSSSPGSQLWGAQQPMQHPKPQQTVTTGLSKRRLPV